MQPAQLGGQDGALSRERVVPPLCVSYLHASEAGVVTLAPRSGGHLNDTVQVPYACLQELDRACTRRGLDSEAVGRVGDPVGRLLL